MRELRRLAVGVRTTTRDLWRSPDPFAWTVRYLESRDYRFNVVNVIWLGFLFSTTTGSLEGLDTDAYSIPWLRFVVGICYGVSALTAAVMLVVKAARYRLVSYFGIAIADVAIAASVIGIPSAAFYVLAITQFGLVVGYLAWMHTLRAQVLHLAFSTVVLLGVLVARGYAMSPTDRWTIPTLLYLAMTPLIVGVSTLILAQHLRAEAAMVDIDALTGVRARFAMLRSISLLLASRDARAAGVSMCLFDLDRFKAINDEYGHGVGDQVLQVLGRELLERASGDIIVGRLGGEEFVVAACGASRAEEMATMISDAVRATDMRLGLTRGLTASVGIATVDWVPPVYRISQSARAALTAELLSSADASMYTAKSSGGDGWVATEFTHPVSDVEDEFDADTTIRDWRVHLLDKGRFARNVVHLKTTVAPERYPIGLVHLCMVVVPPVMAVLAIAIMFLQTHTPTQMRITLVGAGIVVAAGVLAASGRQRIEGLARMGSVLFMAGVIVIAAGSPNPVLMLIPLATTGIYVASFYRYRDFAYYVVVCVAAVAAMLAWSPYDATGRELATFAALNVTTNTLMVILAVPCTLVMMFAVLEFDARRSAIDEMTGALNRLGLDRHMWWFAAHRHDIGAPRCDMAVLVIDLDNFKQINDTWGHRTGDRVLVAVATTLRRTLDDLGVFAFVARTGGDEFVVVSTMAGVADGSIELLRNDHRVATPGSLMTPMRPGRSVSPTALASTVRHGLSTIEEGITVSVGVSVIGDDGVMSSPGAELGLAVAQAVGIADRLMYEAKSAGGDRICVAGEGADAGTKAPENRTAG